MNSPSFTASAGKVSSSVRLRDLLRSNTARWALIASVTYALALLLSFGFVYLRTTMIIKGRVDDAIAEESEYIASAPPSLWAAKIAERIRQDPRRVKPIGLFDRTGTRLAGNIEALPANLAPDVPLQITSITRVDSLGRETQSVRALVTHLANDETLIVAWYLDYNQDVAESLRRALAYSLVPTLLIGLLTGVFLSRRTQRQVEKISTHVQRIIAGDLKERLPNRGTEQPFDKLAGIVNIMLDAMEVLINDLAGVADDIAHDIRTPLARARIALERSRINATSIGPLQRVVDAAVGDIDRALAIVTALLRIRAIEHIRRRESFEQVDLAAIVNDVGDFYRPIAEENGLSLDVELLIERTLQADRDLLTEAIANLVDNAVKFTPSGGRVTLSLLEESGESLIRVSDTGPGIHDSERDLVMRRFYRSDSTRHAAGNGLGLSLVSAVVRLHGFHFVIGRGPGFTAEIHCEDALWRPVPDHGHY